MQEVLVVLIFIAAMGYLIFMVRAQFSSKSGGCPKGCGCSALDIEKIEQELKGKNL